MIQTLEYHTSLPVHECLARLSRTAAEHPWSVQRLWLPLPEGTVESTVWGQRFFLSAWPPLNTRNSFAPVFYGRLLSDAAGTRVVGRFLLYPIAMAFLAVWFGGTLFWLLVALYLEPMQRAQPVSLELSALGPIAAASGLTLFASLLVRFAVRSGVSQRQAIQDYLRSVLEASPWSEATAG